MQDLRIQTLQENSATMVKQINYLENKVLTMEAKIEKLEKGDAKPKKHHKK
jgi:cell division protein FtsB